MVERSGAPFRAIILLLIALLLEAPLTTRYFWPQRDGFMPLGGPIGDDFVNGWASIRLAAASRLDVLFDHRQYTPAINQIFGHDVMHHFWSYPPTALLLYVPFLHVGYYTALAIWTTLGLSVFLIVARFYLGRWDWLPLVMLLTAPATWITLIDGQNGFLTASLFIGGCLAMRRYPLLTGALFGLLTFKPQLGLILPFALAVLRAWRAIVIAGLGAAVFAALSIAVFGFDAWTKYLSVTTAYETRILIDFSGFFTGLVVSVYGGLRHCGLSCGLCFAAQAICALAVVILACRVLPGIGDARHRTLILASAAPLMTPYVLGYDLPLLSIPLAGALFGKESFAHWRIAAFAAAWLVPVLTMWCGFSKFPASQIACPIILSVSFYAAISHKAGRREENA